MILGEKERGKMVGKGAEKRTGTRLGKRGEKEG